ncbi:MAG: hypothetical protein ACSHX4_01880 [Opitutaceae bacterium]
MNHWPQYLFLACLLAMQTQAFAQSQITQHNFKVIERKADATNGEVGYYYRHIYGTERTNNALNRLSILSEDQSIYPIPESGCGPTAMLNILIWYEKFGLIRPFSREANSASYKQIFFKEIDRRLLELTGEARTEDRGSSNLASAMVMDEFVRELSDDALRLHAEAVEPPYQLKTFLDLVPNFRTAYLVVRSKNPETGEMSPVTHAATFIRADRSGYITLGTWGEVYRGLLKKRGSDQWFIPQNPEHKELKLLGMLQFIPFEPAAVVNN